MTLVDDADAMLLAMVSNANESGRDTFDLRRAQAISGQTEKRAAAAVRQLAKLGDVTLLTAATAAQTGFLSATITDDGRLRAESLSVKLAQPQPGPVAAFVETEVTKRGNLWKLIAALIGIAIGAATLAVTLR
jgi:hypothetical protein